MTEGSLYSPPGDHARIDQWSDSQGQQWLTLTHSANGRIPAGAFGKSEPLLNNEWYYKRVCGPYFWEKKTFALHVPTSLFTAELYALFDVWIIFYVPRHADRYSFQICCVCFKLTRHFHTFQNLRDTGSTKHTVREITLPWPGCLALWGYRAMSAPTDMPKSSPAHSIDWPRCTIFRLLSQNTRICSQNMATYMG